MPIKSSQVTRLLHIIVANVFANFDNNLFTSEHIIFMKKCSNSYADAERNEKKKVKNTAEVY